MVARGARVLCIATFAAALSAAVSYAQDVPAAPGASPAATHTGLGEVLVTARKQVESAQDVPVAVTVITNKDIERFDLTSIEKIAASTPQLVVGRGSNGSGAQLTLRGIGSIPTSVGVEQSVAVVIDGVYYGQGRIINEGMIDMARVEVLKGPQSLFFGKNATAGVISFTTADPTDDLEAMVRVGFEAKAQELFTEAFISGPVNDKLGLRLAVRVSEMFGSYFKNRGFDVTNYTFDAATGNLNSHFAPVLDRRLPGTSEKYVRATAKFTPTDRLTATVKASFMRTVDEATAWNYVPFACASGYTSVNPAIPCKRDFSVYINYFPNDIAGNVPYGRDDGSPFNAYQSYAVTGNIAYDFDNVTLTSVSNYQRNRNRWGCECQNISAPASFISATENSLWEAFSNETRLQTNYDGPVNMMIGFYYQDTKRDHRQAGAFGGVEDSSQPADHRYLAYDKSSVTNGKTLSGFGQVKWKIVPTLELSGGVRYIHETKKSFLNMDYVNVLLQGVFPQNSPIYGDQKFNNWSPEASLTWLVNDNVTLYTSYKTAYKSGGFSNSAFISANTIPSDVAFNPETASGFEAGIKTLLFDRQLRFNLTAYTYKYKNLQVDYYNSITFQFITTNAGSARTQGVELEADYAPDAVPGLTLHGTANYNRARYIQYIAPCYGGQPISEGCTTVFQDGPGQNLSGQPTAVAPKWTASLGGNYDIDLGPDWVLSLSANARYSSAYFGSSFAAPLSRQPAYVNLDAAIRVRSHDDRWEFAVIGRNLTNHFYFGGTQDLPNSGVGTGTAGGIPADQLALADLPRTIRFQVTWRY
ncbi:MAG: TonB-dependent receptor [Alphaproteobacteria bacterium]|nr:TonB-dependent receptor [Alphaproteobacteria bacterium]